MTEVARLDCRSARVAHAGLHAEQKDAVNLCCISNEAQDLHVLHHFISLHVLLIQADKL